MGSRWSVPCVQHWSTLLLVSAIAFLSEKCRKSHCVTFSIFEFINDTTAFHTQLNFIHPALQFTIEMVNHCTLPVLDVLAKCKDCLLITSVYRKLTFTGLYTNWNSSMSSKIDLISTLTYGALMICSLCPLNQETEKIHCIFIDSNFPTNVVKCVMQRKF